MQTDLQDLELLLDDARYYLRKVEGDSTGLSEVVQLLIEMVEALVAAGRQ